MKTNILKLSLLVLLVAAPGCGVAVDTMAEEGTRADPSTAFDAGPSSGEGEGESENVFDASVPDDADLPGDDGGTYEDDAEVPDDGGAPDDAEASNDGGWPRDASAGPLDGGPAPWPADAAAAVDAGPAPADAAAFGP